MAGLALGYSHRCSGCYGKLPGTHSYPVVQTFIIDGFLYGSLSPFNSSLLLRRDEGVIPFSSPLFVLNHLSDAYCYINYSNTALKQFIHQKGVDNLELISRRNQRVWSQEKRRESQNRERTAGKIEPSVGSDLDETTILSTFSPLTCSLVWPMKVSGKQFLNFFTQLCVYPDKVVLAAF